MEFFKKNTHIDFMGQRLWAFIFSGIIFIVSTLSIIINGLNFGLDFTGGTQIEVHYNQTADLNTIREQLDQHGFSEAIVQAYGTSQDVLIRLAPTHTSPIQPSEIPSPAKGEGVSQDILKAKLSATLPNANIERIEFIGSQVGSTLITNGLLAILISLIATMLYIAIRFEYRFAISAAVSMIHDPILILGIFSLFHLEFNLISLTAILTILGFSLNDTIVVYDRVRENFQKMRNLSPVDIMNLSINQTLSRTIMTSGLTALAVIALLIFGGATLFSFSLALIIGIVIGTYSSIYIAGALAIVLGLNRESLFPPANKELDNRP